MRAHRSTVSAGKSIARWCRRYFRVSALRGARYRRGPTPRHNRRCGPPGTCSRGGDAKGWQWRPIRAASWMRCRPWRGLHCPTGTSTSSIDAGANTLGSAWRRPAAASGRRRPCRTTCPAARTLAIDFGIWRGRRNGSARTSLGRAVSLALDPMQPDARRGRTTGQMVRRGHGCRGYSASRAETLRRRAARFSVDRRQHPDAGRGDTRQQARSRASTNRPSTISARPSRS